MTPSARIAAAIAVLDARAAGQPAEQALINWARASRFAGSGDRAAVRDHVFGVIRRLRSCVALGGGANGRALMLGALRDDGIDPAPLFDGARHHPAPLTEAEGAHLVGRQAVTGGKAPVLLLHFGLRLVLRIAGNGDHVGIDLLEVVEQPVKRLEVGLAERAVLAPVHDDHLPAVAGFCRNLAAADLGQRELGHVRSGLQFLGGHQWSPFEVAFRVEKARASCRRTRQDRRVFRAPPHRAQA